MQPCKFWMWSTLFKRILFGVPCWVLGEYIFQTNIISKTQTWSPSCMAAMFHVKVIILHEGKKQSQPHLHLDNGLQSSLWHVRRPWENNNSKCTTSKHFQATCKILSYNTKGIKTNISGSQLFTSQWTLFMDLSCSNSCDENSFNYPKDTIITNMSEYFGRIPFPNYRM